MNSDHNIGVANSTCYATSRVSTASVITDSYIEGTENDIEFQSVKDDIIAIKKILIELANDENLLERNVIIRDILSEWLIKGLKK